jgi:hypothetical protein
VCLCRLDPWRITGWEFRAPFLGLELTRYLGALLILAGVPGLIDSFTQFAVKGLGTPAPIAPTPNLSIRDLLRGADARADVRRAI